MILDFIGQLYESRLFPNKETISTFSEEEVRNMIFLYFLALQILSDEPLSQDFAYTYLYKTFKYGKFTKVELSSTDLSWLLFELTQKYDKHFNVSTLNTWVKAILKDKSTTEFDSRHFLWLQSQLNIKDSNYKSMRILISHWTNLTLNQKKLSSTRLLLAFKTHIRKSDLLSTLENIIKHKNLEIDVAKNPELESNIFEDFSATSSGAIASVVQPLQTTIKKRTVKKGIRNKRKA